MRHSAVPTRAMNAQGDVIARRHGRPLAEHKVPHRSAGHVVHGKHRVARVVLKQAVVHHADRAADPVVAGSAIVMGLQSIVARNVDPQETAVITVGAFNAGVANNVIPQRATLRLSVRALNREVRELLEKRITELAHAQAQSYGVQAHVDYKRGYPVLVNNLAETDFARSVAEELVGAGRVTRQGRALTGSEDFAFFLEEVPGCYLLIGNGDGSGDGHGACMVHNPGYDFNDNNVAVGSAYWSLLVERFLKD